MRQNRSTQVYTQPSKEEQEEGNPSQVLHCTTHHATVSESVFEQCKAQITQSGENDDTSEEDFERVQVETIYFSCETEEQKVDDGADAGRGNAVVGKHVWRKRWSEYTFLKR